MGLFSWMRGKTEEPADANPSPDLALLFLFDRLPPLAEETLARRLAAFDETGAVRILDAVSGDGVAHARLAIGPHRFRLVGFGNPAPKEAVENAIKCSHWRQEDKQPLRDHESHVLCYYVEGSDDPTERMLALWKLAGTFLDDGLHGIVDSEAWNCIPAPALRQMLTPEMLATCRNDLPLGIWTGFAKLFKTEDDVWFCSKGFHRWGVMDFAYLGKHSEAEEAFGLLNGLFRYVRSSGAAIKPGHTAQFGDTLLRFGEVREYADYLTGPLGTLTVEKVRRQ